ncbi:hypothetical protein V6N13_066484 [Hibiscus sabdariffa]|uniref:Uncharacterized protein n=1 Tax=Hibiscus sabdariffa TaxID=183260 RepID=A0ABR2DTP2_9ROSI
MPWSLILIIAENNIDESRRFEAGIGRYARNAVAVLRILSRLHVLPPTEHRLPPLFVPLAPSQLVVVATRLRRDHHHDHHIIFPTNLLHFSMRSIRSGTSYTSAGSRF